MNTQRIAGIVKQLSTGWLTLWQREDGANLVLMALVITVLLGFAGLAVDGSNIYYQTQRMQISADAAALGGARKLAASADHYEVNAEIEQLAFANDADSVEWEYINDNRGVHVVASRAFPAYFARIYGHSVFTVTAEAEAQYEPVTGVDGLFPLTLDCDCVDEEDIIPVEDGEGGGGGSSSTATPTPMIDTTPSAGTVQLADGQSSSYGITYLGQAGNTWSYQVEEINGRDLSHWLLSIETCLSNIVSYTPSGAEIGTDGSTGVPGIKWNTSDNFSSGTFAFTLDNSYPSGFVDALAKAGNTYGTVSIRGPICDGTNTGDSDSGGSSGSASLCLPTLDFETDTAGAALVAGQIIDTEWAAWGMRITTNDPSSHPAMIFNTANPTGGDIDLGAANEAYGGPGIGVGGGPTMPGRNSAALGKVLVVAETSNSSIPDDSANGGTLIFTFDYPVRVDEVKILDIDNAAAAGTIKAYKDSAGTTLVATGKMQGFGDNSFQTVPVNGKDVRRLEIKFPQSGAVASIVSCRAATQATYRLSNLVWYDVDGDGIQDLGEPGIAGVKLELYLSEQNYVIATATSNAGGEYVFTNLPMGNYEVKIAASNFLAGGVLQGAAYSPKDATGNGAPPPATAIPTDTPTNTPTAVPTNTPTTAPTNTPTMTPTSTATVQTGPCTVSYLVSNDTGSSFKMDLNITNGGSAAWSSWVLAFTFPGNQQISSVTNGAANQSGSSVQISHVGWNAAVAAGGSASLSFLANYSGSNGVPADFKINGVACSGSGGGVIAGTATATPAPTNTPTPTSLPTATPTRPAATATSTIMNAKVNGQTYYVAYQGEEMPVDVTVNLTTSANWRRTSYRFGSSGSWNCVDTPNNDGSGWQTESLEIDAPNSTGTYQLYVRAHANSNNCNDNPVSGRSTQMPVVVVSQPSTTANPNLATACGLNVILVLDESYSIQQSGATGNVRTAANAFLDGLLDTGSRVAIVEFNSTARQVFGYTEVNAANLTTLQRYVNDNSGAPQGGYDPTAYSSSQYYTNWQDAFIKVKALNNSSAAPLVVFVTDGDPTIYYRADGQLYSNASATASTAGLNKAIVEANAVKSQGSHILTVGVGSSLDNTSSRNRLKAISGNDVYSGGALDLSTIDVMLVTSFSGLATALEQIVTSLCQSSVTITKLLDPGSGNYSAASGWQFSASAKFPAPSGTNFSWVLPSAAAGTQTVFGATGTNGTLTFQLKPNSSSGTSTISISEAAQAGYAFESVVCTKTSGDGTITTVTGNPFTISNIAANAIVTCVVKNKLVVTPKLTLLKTASQTTYTAAGNVINYTYKLTNDGNVNLKPPYAVVDNKTTVTCPGTPATLTPGSSLTCTATYVITQADMNAGSVTNLAQATAKDTNNLTVISNQDDATVTGPAPTATPLPTNTPLPTATPTVTPTPGANDDTIDSDFDPDTGRAPAIITDADNSTVDGGFILPDTGPTSAIINLNDVMNSQYEVTLVGTVDKTWTYRVRKISGRDLSYWSLGITNCIDKIVSYSPTASYSSGTDASTGFVGTKWTLPVGYTDGTFSITLDLSYQARPTQALIKADTLSAQVGISGPDCTLPNIETPEEEEEETPGGGSGGEGDACSFGWVDWNSGTNSQLELANYMANTELSGIRSLNEVLTRGPEVVYSSAVAAELNALMDSGATVKIPLTTFNGSGYAICGFANVKLLDYQLETGDNWLNLQFLQTLIRGVTTDPDAPDYGARDVRFER